MFIFRDFILGMAIVLTTAFCIFGLVSTANTSNCGGNSAALHVCGDYAGRRLMWEDAHEDKSFDITGADEDDAQFVASLGAAHWLGGARLLGTVGDGRLDASGERRIIIVCDRPFSNVPRRTFGQAPLTHAVGYSTGEVGLISPEEFAALDLSKFVDLQALAPSTDIRFKNLESAQSSASGNDK